MGLRSKKNGFQLRPQFYRRGTFFTVPAWNASDLHTLSEPNYHPNMQNVNCHIIPLQYHCYTLVTFLCVLYCETRQSIVYTLHQHSIHRFPPNCAHSPSAPTGFSYPSYISPTTGLLVLDCSAQSIAMHLLHLQHTSLPPSYSVLHRALLTGRRKVLHDNIMRDKATWIEESIFVIYIFIKIIFFLSQPLYYVIIHPSIIIPRIKECLRMLFTYFYGV